MNTKFNSITNTIDWIKKNKIITVLICFNTFIYVSIAINEPALEIDISRPGWTTFYEIFEIPLKFSGVLIAIFSLSLLFKRTKQNEEQLDLIDENNRFNNYKTYRTDFIDYFKDRYPFKNMLEVSQKRLLPSYVGIEINNLLLPIFKLFFGSSYDKFSFKIFDFHCVEINTLLDRCQQIIQEIDKIEINIPELSREWIGENETQENEFKKVLDPLIAPWLYKKFKEFSSNIYMYKFSQSDPSVTEMIKFAYINLYILHFAIYFYLDLLIYTGETRPIDSKTFSDLKKYYEAKKIGFEFVDLD